MSGLVLYMASIEAETDYCLYVLDLMYHVLHEHDPEAVGKFNDKLANDESEKTDEKRLRELMKRESAGREIARTQTVLSR